MPTGQCNDCPLTAPMRPTISAHTGPTVQAMTTITIEKRLLEQLYLYWLEDADPDELDEFRDEVLAALLAAQQPQPEHTEAEVQELFARYQEDSWTSFADAVRRILGVQP